MDSPVAYKFAAAPDNWARGGTAIRAITIHMAEGGGTVSWLTRNDGNSSHYVVEYDGRVVQMVLESRAAGSINPREVRTDNDAAYTFRGETIRYGVTAAQKVCAGAWSDPNLTTIAIEIEGFAASGPNLAQQAGLIRLVEDIRKRRPGIGLLGHRDWQNYKACPGHRIDWAALGGHGPYIAQPEAEMPSLSAYLPGQTITVKPTANVRFDAKLAASVRRVVSTAETWAITGSVKGDVDPDTGSDVWYVRWQAATWEFTAKGNVTSGPTVPVAAPDPAALAAAAKTARGLALEQAHTAGSKGAGDAIDALPR